MGRELRPFYVCDWCAVEEPATKRGGATTDSDRPHYWERAPDGQMLCQQCSDIRRLALVRAAEEARRVRASQHKGNTDGT